MSRLPVEIIRLALSSAADLSVALAAGTSVEQRRDRERFVAYLVEWLGGRSVVPLAMRGETYAEVTGATLRIVSRWTDVAPAAAWELVLAALDEQRRTESSSASTAAA